MRLQGRSNRGTLMSVAVLLILIAIVAAYLLYIAQPA